MLNFLRRMVEYKIDDATASFSSGNGSRMKPIAEILEIIRLAIVIFIQLSLS